MDVRLHMPSFKPGAAISVGGSKSITNRLLLLKAMYPEIAILNASRSDDSEVMERALETGENVIDVHHAGTAMRFLTAYFAALQGREVTITGSSRMQERPISVLVDALRALGADISYLKNEGFPPLKINGKKLEGGTLAIKANVSSQYITALLLIAGKFENGIELVLEGEITSRPYIEMTLSLLKEVGIEVDFSGNIITVKPGTRNPEPETLLLTVESDWSSASYFYSIVALSPEGTKISLTSFRHDSLQGDSVLKHIYKALGVETDFHGDTITLTRTNLKPTDLSLSLLDSPDLAQTIAVTCFGLGIGCHLTGLHTLKIKETDRLHALNTELKKLGAEIETTSESITIAPNRLFTERDRNAIFASTPIIETYNDHRMAMAFAPLAVKMPLSVRDAGVVSKSYPGFWNDLQRLGFVVEYL